VQNAFPANSYFPSRIDCVFVFRDNDENVRAIQSCVNQPVRIGRSRFYWADSRKLLIVCEKLFRGASPVFGELYLYSSEYVLSDFSLAAFQS